MPEKTIMWFGRSAKLFCDGLCGQAWGINWTGEKGETAPDDPGTYEGGHGKDAGSLNKWCARECERSNISEL